MNVLRCFFCSLLCVPFLGFGLVQPELVAQSSEVFCAFNWNLPGQEATLIENQLTESQGRSHKYLVAKKVFDQLLDCKKSLGDNIPEFELSNGKKYTAYLKPTFNSIGLETAAYDVCTSFGKDSLNALAFLLAHELVHHYEKHTWLRIQGKNLTQSPSPDVWVLQEAQADYEGAALAFMAGFEPFVLIPELLKKITATYQLSQQPIGYPSQAERIEIAAKSLNRINTFYAYFSMAKYLTVLGDFPAAHQYFKKLATEYPAKEVFNNVGTTAALVALEYFSQEEFPYFLPLTIDINSRLNIRSRPMDLEKRQMWLEAAENAFGRALANDKYYPEALLNLACVQILKGAPQRAKFYLDELAELTNPPDSSPYLAQQHILLGILAARQGNPTSGLAHFEKAQHLGAATLATLNKAKLMATPLLPDSTRRTRTDRDNVADETIAGKTIGELAISLDCKQGLPINGIMKLCVGKFPTSTTLLHFIDSSHYLLIHQTNQNHLETTANGVKIGDPASIVLQAYGASPRRMEFKGETFWIYSDHNLVFTFDHGQKVKHWSLFRLRQQE